MPNYAYAGRFSETFADSRGNVHAGLPVTVYKADGVTVASLYTSRLKVTSTPNPTAASANGILTFYADPGTYHLVATYAGVAQAPVEAHVPGDPAPVLVYNSFLAAWVDSPRSIWVWGTGDPNPLALMAENDLVLGDGT